MSIYFIIIVYIICIFVSLFNLANLIFILGSEHNYRVSMPSTSRDSCSSHSNSHEFNKRVTYKTNDKNSYQFRKKWENKTYLIRKQLNSESSRNNTFIPR